MTDRDMSDWQAGVIAGIEIGQHNARVAAQGSGNAGELHRQALRELVDVVWNEATESTTVPDRPWADRLIDRVFGTAAQAQPPRRQPVTDAAIETLAKQYDCQNAPGFKGFARAIEHLAQIHPHPPVSQPVTDERPTMDERATFEHHFRADDLRRDPDEPDQYSNYHVQTQWEGWQARAALAQQASGQEGENNE